MAKNLGKFLLVLWITLSIIGCGGGGKTSSPGKIASIVVNASSAYVIYNGGSKQFSATALDQNGNVVNANFTWTVNDPAYGSIDSSGKFTAGSQKGTCIVTCSAGTVKKEIQVVVGELKKAGPQLVNDLQQMIGSIEDETSVYSKLSRLWEKTGNLSGHVGYTLFALEHSFNYCFEFKLFPKVFKFDPGQYTVDAIRNGAPAASYQTGTWTITYSDNRSGLWTNTVTRTVENGFDKVVCDIRYSIEPRLAYHVELSYPSAEIETGVVKLQAKFEDEYLRVSTLSGEANWSRGAGMLTIDGSSQWKFTGNDDFLESNGRLELVAIGEASAKLSFKGSLETAELLASNDISFAIVQNKHQEYFPESLTLNGSIQDKPYTIALHGRFALQFGNSANFNPGAEYGGGNILQGKLTLNGGIPLNAVPPQQLEGTLLLEEIAAKHFRLTFTFNLSNGGVSRDVILKLENINKGGQPSDFDLRCTAQSEWLASTLDFYLNFGQRVTEIDSPSHLKNVTGTLVSEGTQIATVVKSDIGWIKIQYNDGSFETL